MPNGAIPGGHSVRVQNTATSAAITHGDLVAQSGFVGIAIKTLAKDSEAALVSPATIADDEEYNLVLKGDHRIADTGISTPGVGDLVYVILATNAKTKTVGTNVPAGRIKRVETGFVTISLDHKI